MDQPTKPPMKEQVPYLRTLQDLDRQIFRWTKDKTNKPKALDPVLKELGTKKAEHDAKAKDLAGARGEVSKRELDLKEREERRLRLEGQRDQSKSNKEYQAYNFEIAAIKSESGKIEDEVLKLMSAVEEAVKVAGDAKDVLSVVEAKHAEAKKVVDADISKIEDELKAVRERRAEAAKAVHEEYLKIYDRIFKSKSDNVALACVTKMHDTWHCGSCKMEITFQDLNTILKGRDPVVCRSCSRIMYAEAKPEAASAK